MSTHSILDKKLTKNRTFKEIFITFPSFLILLAVLLLSSGEYVHSRLLALGNTVWPGYTTELKLGYLEEQSCQSVESVLNESLTRWKAMPEEDEFGFEKDPFNEEAMREGATSTFNRCVETQERIRAAKEKITPSMTAFAKLETSISKVVSKSSTIKKPLFIVLVLLCAIATTFARHHISLRPVVSRRDYLFSFSAQVLALCFLVVSSVLYYKAELANQALGIVVSDLELHLFWIAGFVALLVVAIFNLLKVNSMDLPEAEGFVLKSLLSIPLFAFMAIIAGFQFFFLLNYPTGISVTMTQITDFIDIFLKLALYIWMGMMLKQTRIAQLFFNVLRPWNMSSELMCFIVLLCAAVPTAYTGASGIFIIAAGAIIFNEIRLANTRGQLALAVTAMSGSMGVVIYPCLLIVLIAAVNDGITTDELFGAGKWVFILTAVLFFIISQLTRQDKITIAPVREAFPKSVAALVPLIPYVLVFFGVLTVYQTVFKQGMDPYSAPVILPIVLLSIIIYEKVFSRSVQAVMDNALNTNFVALSDRADEHVPSKTVEQSFRFATSETTEHIGALILLMILSICVGGLIERSGIMSHILPADFASIWMLLSILVVFLVIVGMIMDPTGAIILVNATITPIAYANGINPLHFWLITLVAFELGYLSPPVALNHLLTRHIVGEEEVLRAYAEPLAKDNFWYRHERYLLPIAIMGTALLLVAFVPPMVGWLGY